MWTSSLRQWRQSRCLGLNTIKWIIISRRFRWFSATKDKQRDTRQVHLTENDDDEMTVHSFMRIYPSLPFAIVLKMSFEASNVDSQLSLSVCVMYASHLPGVHLFFAKKIWPGYWVLFLVYLPLYFYFTLRLCRLSLLLFVVCFFNFKLVSPDTHFTSLVSTISSHTRRMNCSFKLQWMNTNNWCLLFHFMTKVSSCLGDTIWIFSLYFSLNWYAFYSSHETLNRKVTLLHQFCLVAHFQILHWGAISEMEVDFYSLSSSTFCVQFKRTRDEVLTIGVQFLGQRKSFLLNKVWKNCCRQLTLSCRESKSKSVINQMDVTCRKVTIEQRVVTVTFAFCVDCCFQLTFWFIRRRLLVHLFSFLRTFFVLERGRFRRVKYFFAFSYLAMLFVRLFPFSYSSRKEKTFVHSFLLVNPASKRHLCH